MHIHIFQSYQGDCILIEDAAKAHRILSDGGTPKAMEDSIATELAAWQAAGQEVDLVYVSHIDSDHIGGIAVLLDLLVQWKVYDFHNQNGDPSTQPALPRPPKVRAIWHNAFRDIITKNQGAIEKQLAASAPFLQASLVPELIELGADYAQIANSVKEALTVSRLIKPELLNIPLNELRKNPQHTGKLLMNRVGQQPEIVGGLSVTIVGPTASELSNLRKGWNNWLRDEGNRKTAKKIRNLYADQLESSTGLGQSNPLDLHEWEGIPAYKGVTAPNVASTVLLVEEQGKTLLLTGDNHPDMVLQGLKSIGRLDSSGLHLDVLKYPHHGSEHNVSKAFPRDVSADHYIFCGDGSNTNPEISVLESMLEARVGPASKRAKSNMANNRPFKFWFSTSSTVQTPGPKQDHMKRVEKWAEAASQLHPGLFSYEFSDTPYMTLAV